MTPSSLVERVAEAMRAAGLLRPAGCTLVVAVSGGPDSMALLELLRVLSQKQTLRLHAAHLNHGLRGPESDADSRYVQETCDRMGIPVSVEKADVAGLRAKRRLSWEAAAREARYAFLARVASTTDAHAVVLGHTADDQAETVLLHLLRGSGIRGLRGMLPVSRWRSSDGTRDVVLVRPLLQVTRHETEAYCTGQDLHPRYDSSNLEERFTRNRIRRSLMPQLQKYNPAVREALTRLAATVAQDLAYIDRQVQELWPALVTREPRGLRLRRDAFNGLHPSLQAHLLQRACTELMGEATGLNLAQVEGMRSLAAKGAGRSMHLGHGLRFSTTYDELRIGWTAPGPAWPSIEEVALPAPGERCVQGWRIRLRQAPAGEFPTNRGYDDPYRAYLSLDAVGRKLWVRSRRAGDSFQPLGMEGTKRLKEFMIDAHVPRALREGAPLVVGEKGIAWVVGWRIAHWARVTPETQQVLELSFAREA